MAAGGESTRRETASQPPVRLGHPDLTTLEAIGQALLVGPIAGAGFGLYLVAFHAGAASPFVLVAILVAVMALAWTISRYGRHFAGPGTIYEYIARAHSRSLGTISGFWYVAAVGCIFSAIALIVGLLFQVFAQTELGFDPGWWTGAVAAALFMSFMTYSGIRLAVRAQLALTLLSAIPFLVLALDVIFDGGPAGNTLAAFDPGEATGRDLFRGFLVALILLGGWEAAAALGEETRTPHRSIPRAMLITVVACGVFYVAIAYIGVIGFGPDQVAAGWGENPVGLSVLGDQYLGEPGGALIQLAVIVDFLVIIVAAGNQLSRGFFALARDGVLPRALATSSKHGTPLGGIVLCLLLSLTGIAVAAAAFDDRFGYIEMLVVVPGIVVAPIFLTLALGSVRLVRSARARIRRLPVALVASAVPALGVYGAFDPFPTGTERWGLVIAGAILIGGLALFAYLALRRPAVLAHAGDYAAVASSNLPSGPDRAS